MAGREVTVNNRTRCSSHGRTNEFDLVRYYLAVADGALRGVGDAPWP